METATLYGGDVVLELDGRHCYWASINGREKKKVIGVTSVSGLLDKPGLKYWAVDLACDHIKCLVEAEQAVTLEEIEEARKKHTTNLKEAAESGTSVHDWVEAFINSQINGTSAPAIPEQEVIMNGALAFMRWTKEHAVRFISAERLVYSIKYGYGGKMDAEAFVDGKRCVLDWKTSKPRKPGKGKENKECPHGCGKVGCGGIYDEHRLQTAAYQLAAEEEGTLYDGLRKVVRLDKETGEFSVHELPNYDEDARAFQKLLAVKKWMNKI